MRAIRLRPDRPASVLGPQETPEGRKQRGGMPYALAALLRLRVEERRWKEGVQGEAVAMNPHEG